MIRILWEPGISTTFALPLALRVPDQWAETDLERGGWAAPEFATNVIVWESFEPDAVIVVAEPRL
ncbi:MAG: hypothetical protein ACYCWN_12805 [Ferrimicrobium sp.]|uniref:hypothetical protein n=1 Tax=Ferrimicrobium acidiphilum TaxID=121039 RepID=UPI0034DD69CE